MTVVKIASLYFAAIIGELLSASKNGRIITVKVDSKFKPTADKTKFAPQNIVKMVVQKPTGCRCENLEFVKNEKYVLMGKRVRRKKIFVIKWKTGFVEKVSASLEVKLKKTAQKSKAWGFCALKRSQG